jgi:hypothetical protein
MGAVIPYISPVLPKWVNPRILCREYGTYYCPWHGKCVERDITNCTDRLFFQSNGLSPAQFQGLGHLQSVQQVPL